MNVAIENWAEQTPEKNRQQRRLLVGALLGIVLTTVGLLLALPQPYKQRLFLIDAGGCHLQTAVFEPAREPRGTVILLHGLVANRKVMTYLAEGFAGQRLRVFVPDLPGHGRTAGPFSPARAEECSGSLLEELRARGLAPPDRTVLVGHSMGGAIAIRVAVRVPVAGVIAISPAPMRAAHGVAAETLLYEDPPTLPPNTLVISGRWEFDAMRGNAADLLSRGRDVHANYVVIPGATHASLLSSASALRVMRSWTAEVLHFSKDDATPGATPSRWPTLGSLLGFVGLLLVAGPFLREASGKTPVRSEAEISPNLTHGVAWWRASAEILGAGMLAVLILERCNPLKIVRLFEGDYLAGFLLLTGLLLILLHWKAVSGAMDFPKARALGAVFASVALVLLFTAWCELTLTEAWLDMARWQRFPVVFLGVLPYLVSEEILLGAPALRSAGRRLLIATFFRLLLGAPLLIGVIYLHSGEILVVLLSLYFALFSVLQRRGMDVVRTVTRSPAAAALFGAILLAGFFLVIFPLL
jgi:alpha-beta hydrolase superfamily lysophospholipase